MKKTYALWLDQEAVEAIKEWVEPKGLNLSSYVNAMLIENVEAIKLLDGVADLKDLPLGSLVKLYAGMLKGFERKDDEPK